MENKMMSNNPMIIINQLRSTGSNPVGIARSNAQEPIKKVGFCCLMAIFIQNLTRFLVTLRGFVETVEKVKRTTRKWESMSKKVLYSSLWWEGTVVLD